MRLNIPLTITADQWIANQAAVIQSLTQKPIQSQSTKPAFHHMQGLLNQAHKDPTLTLLAACDIRKDKEIIL